MHRIPLQGKGLTPSLRRIQGVSARTFFWPGRAAVTPEQVTEVGWRRGRVDGLKDPLFYTGPTLECKWDSNRPRALVLAPEALIKSTTPVQYSRNLLQSLHRPRMDYKPVHGHAMALYHFSKCVNLGVALPTFVLLLRRRVGPGLHG
jgi:hypothetical protein